MVQHLDQLELWIILTGGQAVGSEWLHLRVLMMKENTLAANGWLDYAARRLVLTH
jgi:hypothetical protein